MKKYEVIYSFEVLQKAKDKEAVYLVDREKEQVVEVADMQVGELAEVLAIAETEKDRFEFYVRKEEQK